jgi:hypothetical protein
MLTALWIGSNIQAIAGQKVQEGLYGFGIDRSNCFNKTFTQSCCVSRSLLVLGAFSAIYQVSFNSNGHQTARTF